jgi:hypothetical protein
VDQPAKSFFANLVVEFRLVSLHSG